MSWFAGTLSPAYYLKLPLNRLKRDQLRAMTRGSRALRRNGRQFLVEAINDELAAAVADTSGHYSSTMFGACTVNAGIAVRQYALAKFGGWRLATSLLVSIGRGDRQFAYPMPSMWYPVFEEQGVKVDRFRSACLWYAYVCLYWLRGVANLGKNLLKGVAALVSGKQLGPGKHIYFSDLTVKNLPIGNSSNGSYDIVSWYRTWSGRVSALDNICHSVPLDSSTQSVDTTGLYYLQPNQLGCHSAGALLQFALWGASSTAIALYELIRGRWWHAMLFREAVDAALFRINGKETLGEDYLFNNSHPIYRPLWTYEAKKMGAQVTFYFYSTNCERFRRTDNQPTREYHGYKCMTWPRYLVWDLYQSRYFRALAGPEPEIEVVGPVWMNDSRQGDIEFSDDTVAVFDVQPHRNLVVKSLGIDFEYYTPDVTCQFVKDIFSALSEQKIPMAFKRKREIGRQAHPLYRQLMSKLEIDDGFVSIDPDTNAIRLIQKSAAVISMPFTSTGVQAKELGRPSAYYDPFGMVDKNDPAAHGIEVLVGPAELRAWVSRILSTGHTGS